MTASITEVYNHLVEPGFADPRVASWPLMRMRGPICISIIYLLAVPIGNRIMRDREPMKLKTFSLIHNGVLFFLSLYMAVETVRQCYANFGWATYPQWCNPVEPRLSGPNGTIGFTESGAALARVLYIHYVSKAYEFVDTLIMVAKKNKRQISFLHVYHHATTFFPVWWAVVKYGPGGEAWFCCFLNSLVHVFMYGYYFGAALGVKINIVKRCITQFQMIQFCMFITQSVYLLFVTDCYRPRVQPYLLLVQCIIFLTLFTNFYIKSYSKPKSKSS